MTSRQLSPERTLFLKQDYDRGFINFCGFKAMTATWAAFQSRLQVEKCHRQQDGFIHAGVMATMADHTAGYSAFTIVPEGVQILTIEFKINFLRPAFGEALVCESTVIREGRKVMVAESEVFDVRDGERVLAAKAMVTLMGVPQKDLASPAGKAADLVAD